MDSLSNTLTLNVHWNRNGDEPVLDALVEGNKRELHVSKQYSSGSDQELARVLTDWRKAQATKRT